MSSRSRTSLAFALCLTAGAAGAQPVTQSGTAATNAGSANGSAGVVNNNAGGGTTANAVPGVLANAPGAGVAPSAPGAVNNASPASAQANVPAIAPTVPGRAQVPVPSRESVPVLPTETDKRDETAAAPARDVAAAAARPSSDPRAVGRQVSDARLAESAGSEGSVSMALAHIFDAETGRAALHAGPGVAGSAQDARHAIAQKVDIANKSSPANAPSLYLDAIKTAKDALPSPVADAVAAVVRGFAARKADASLGDLASAAYQAAAGGSERETGRLLAAFDKWETLLGAPGKPLISNAEALKSGVQGLLKSAGAGEAHSAPHVWFTKKGGAFTAVLPGDARVAAVPALAAAFALAPAALEGQTVLSDAYRAFAADPRASTGARLIYRSRQALGAPMPAAAVSAATFWLRAAFEAVWRRIVAFFSGRGSYALGSRSGQDALRREAALAASTRTESAGAARLLSSPRLTVGGARAALAALARSAEAYRSLSGEGEAAAAVDGLSRSFESGAKGLKPGDALPSGLNELVSGSGGIAHWAERLQAAASQIVDSRFWRSGSAAGVVNLGSGNGVAAGVAAVAERTAGAPVALVALDDSLWASGRGDAGAVRLSATLRPTSAGGAIEIAIERGSPALARRLEDLGLTVSADGAGLRASAGSEDFAMSGEELSLVAPRALAVALGHGVPFGGALRDLADETRRDETSAAALAAALDGREAFARAAVIGLVGEYEALAPTLVSVDGKPLIVSALRDPDTGLLAYARAARPDGAVLRAAEIRALTTRGK